MMDRPHAYEYPSGDFEPSLQRLEAISLRMEAEDLQLGEALALYEEGVMLLKVAEQILGRAEARVQQLVGNGADARLEPLDDAE